MDHQLAELRRAARSEPDNVCLAAAVTRAEMARGLIPKNGGSAYLARVGYSAMGGKRHAGRDGDHSGRRRAAVCNQSIEVFTHVRPARLITCCRCRRKLGLET